MNKEFFTYIPSEIVVDILSRLPVRTIARCKCVCKSWLYLLETHEFVKSHLSKSVPGLAIYQCNVSEESYKIFELQDDLDLEHHHLHYNLITSFDLPWGSIHGSANGLLFCRDSFGLGCLYICNPVTRDYVQLYCPLGFADSSQKVVTHGFGVSKIVGHHKVVRISHVCVRDQEAHELLGIPKSECHVYTLGTGSWRRIAPGTPLTYSARTTGAFLNGNLHWLAFDLNHCPWISCFDLETELFSIFSSPLPGINTLVVGLFALGDCLCLCHNNGSDGVIVIWLMKEYGVEKSWAKEFVISKFPDCAIRPFGVVSPIKVFSDGDILISWEYFGLFYYSKKDKTIEKLDMFAADIDIRAIIHTPSFLSLKSFGVENVHSFRSSAVQNANL